MVVRVLEELIVSVETAVGRRRRGLGALMGASLLRSLELMVDFIGSRRVVWTKGARRAFVMEISMELRGPAAPAVVTSAQSGRGGGSIMLKENFVEWSKLGVLLVWSGEGGSRGEKKKFEGDTAQDL